MENFRKLLAPIVLALVLGVPVWAGEMNSPPAPTPPSTPTSTQCAVTTSGGTLANSTCSGTAWTPAAIDAAMATIEVLVSMLSIY
ncbi:MAG: hypothetical protein JWM21_812 [Acidobacteria bacterium]|nr:hypothetical protein [Acidobacteriota bacterium]